MSEDDREEAEAAADEPPAAGKFYRGHVVKLSSGRQTGLIRSGSGRQIPFTFQHVVMLGEKTRFDDLHIGTEVGYDVSWTSKGLRVSLIRILD